MCWQTAAVSCSLPSCPQNKPLSPVRALWVRREHSDFFLHCKYQGGSAVESERSISVFQEEHTELEIDLWDLAYTILKKIHYVIIAGIIGAVLAAVYVFCIATPMYEATAQLYVVNSRDTALDLSDLQIGTYLTSDYSLVFNTWEVNQQVKNTLNLPYSIDELRKMVTVTNPSDTRALFITVKSVDPGEAAEMANTYADVGKQYIYDTMLSEMPSTLSVALEPNKAVSPQPLRTIALSTLFGAMLAIALLVLHYLRNDKITTPEDLEKHAKVALLAVIPYSESSSHYRNRSRNVRKGRS